MKKTAQTGLPIIQTENFSQIAIPILVVLFDITEKVITLPIFKDRLSKNLEPVRK